MRTTGGRATNKQRDFQHTEMRIPLHFFGNVRHFFERWRNQTRQTNDVGILGFGARQNFGAGHHHAHIHDFKIITLQNHRDNIFANIVHITFDSSNNDFTLGLGSDTGALFFLYFFFFDIRDQVRNGLLHHARRFHHLR